MNRLAAAIVVALAATPALAGSSVTITPLPGKLGPAFDEGPAHGWLWEGVPDAIKPMIGDLYDSMLTINGGAATVGCYDPFCSVIFGTQGFADWTATQAQWTDDLHDLAGPDKGGPTAVITSIRYGYRNTLATSTHTIRLYDMVPPSASGHPSVANPQFGSLLASVAIPKMGTGTAIVTVTGLSITTGPAAWIKFGETGQGFPGTFWLSGGSAQRNSHAGLVYSHKDYYGPGSPLHYFLDIPYIYTGGYDVLGANIQVALGGFVVPAPSAIGLLLGLAGLVTLRRGRHPEVIS